MEFQILGPLEVVEDGKPVALGTLKERLVLAVLLLHANDFVSRERLIDELWGVAPPPTAKKAVNVYVSKLRKTLSRDGRDPISTADGGYRLLVDPDLLDADRVRKLVAGARERMADGESDAASRLLEEALVFWRGPTLAGLALESFGRDEVAQLDELRLTVLMDRIDCDLAQRRHEEVVGELQVLVREHPLRERLRAQQMLALYRADRQADALDAYQQARHDLMDELGIEPSESLQRLQQAILRHDSALEAPAGTAATNGAVATPGPGADVVSEAVPARPRRRRPLLRRRYLVLAGLAAVAAVAVPVAVLSTGGGRRPSPSSPLSSVPPNSVALIDPAGKVMPFPGGGEKPGSMALVGNALWILTRGNDKIQSYDLRSGRGTPPFPAGASPYAIVAASGHVWVSERKPVLTWIRHVGTVTSPYATPSVTTEDVPVDLKTAGSEAVGGGYLWVIPGPLGTDNRVALVDVRHPRARSTTIPLGPGQQTTAIAYGDRYAWITTYDPRNSTASLSRVRPGSRPRPESLTLETGDGAGPFAVAFGEGSVWVITAHGNLLGIDPREFRITHRIVMSAEEPTLLAVAAGSVWTANHEHDDVSQVDPHMSKIVRTIPLGRYDAVPCGIEAARNGVFVAVGETSCG